MLTILNFPPFYFDVEDCKQKRILTLKKIMETQENEKKSRRELEDTIEEQKEKISKYENRLRDMIRAYKGLTKEKEALEKSLKILQKTENSGESDQVQDNAPRTQDRQA